MDDEWRLYWCTTADHYSDGWIVARHGNHARIAFGQHNELTPLSVGVELACVVPSPFPSTLLDVLERLTPVPTAGFLPTFEQLAELGVVFNANFHVYTYQGRIFRPDGLQRALRASRGLAYLMQKRKAQPS